MREKKNMYVNGKDRDFEAFVTKANGCREITAVGQWIRTKYEINYSSVLTRLIQETGRWCEYYASDLFIWWDAVNRYLENRPGTNEEKTFVFGMYKSGVDNAESAVCKLKNTSLDNAYRAVWCLDVQEKEDGNMWMTLYKAGTIEKA